METEDSSLNEQEEAIGDEEEDQVWGLEKGMELFEVSSKDDTGGIKCLILNLALISGLRCPSTF